MSTVDTARRGYELARGLRRLVTNPVDEASARAAIADEVRRRPERLLHALDRLVWPYPASPARRLLEHAGAGPDDVRHLVADRGVEGALDHLRDLGVYVAYEEALGRTEAVRGSARFTFSPPDFFNPVTRADYLGTTGGTRSTGTPVEVSFAWQRRQGMQRAVQLAESRVLGAPTAVWLPVFPSAAGFGAVMKQAAGGNRPERWFSQIPTDLGGITPRKQAMNRFIPAMNALTRNGLPSPEHVPTSDPGPVVAWAADAVARNGRAALSGYASSLTAAARWAADRGVRLDGLVVFPSSEPITAGKRAAMEAAGMEVRSTYAFVPEGTMALACAHCGEEEYHLWEHELAVTTRRRHRVDGAEVDAFLLTSLAIEAPRVLLNVENDDYGTVRRDVGCGCGLDDLGLRTRLAGIRGLSKVVAAGISLDGEVFDRLVEVDLPAALGGGPGDYQFVEVDEPGGTVVTLRVRPGLDATDERLRAVVHDVLRTTDNGVLATAVWERAGGLQVARTGPHVTKAGKTLSYERLGAPAPAIGMERST